MKSTSKWRDGVTLRAILLALALIPIDNYWITVVEVRWYSLDSTCLPLFITPIFILFLLGLTNLWLRSRWPRVALGAGELRTIYIMTAMGATLASHDLIQNLIGTIGHPYYMANDANRYKELFFDYLPAHILVSNRQALNGLYQGHVDPWRWEIIRFWLAPLAAWGFLLIVMTSMMMCVNIIIRKRWTEQEKLTFPLIQLPMQMTGEDCGRRFYANPMMWAGFSIPFAIGLVNGLHVIYPSVPYLGWVKHYDIGQFLTARPWSALASGGNGFKTSAYPFAIGLTYFHALGPVVFLLVLLCRQETVAGVWGGSRLGQQLQRQFGLSLLRVSIRGSVACPVRGSSDGHRTVPLNPCGDRPGGHREMRKRWPRRGFIARRLRACLPVDFFCFFSAD